MTAANDRVKTGIPGFDVLSRGGLPKGRGTLVLGTAGSGKTIFAVQFLVAGIKEHGEPGVFVTFEESKEDVGRDVAGFGWNIKALEDEGKLACVDASPEPEQEHEIVGDYELAPLLARIELAVKKTGAKRLAIDSTSAVFNRFDPGKVRTELFRITAFANKMGVTTVMTMEREEEDGALGRHGVEQFVMDNVVLLKNATGGESRNRSIEILKARGADHGKGENPVVIKNGEGIVVVPFSGSGSQKGATIERISFGIPELDEMVGGGLFGDSITLISGATGTGKTMLCANFVKAGADVGERSVFFGFEESSDEIMRNAGATGAGVSKLVEEGLIKIECFFPESKTPFQHFLHILRTIDEFGPSRICIDSISALERICSQEMYVRFMARLVYELKQRGVAAVFTVAAGELMGGATITQSHISTISDAILLLRYLEVYGEMKRGMVVLKLRGSANDRRLHEFFISEEGIRIAGPFRDISGVFSQSPSMFPVEERDRIGKKYRET